MLFGGAIVVLCGAFVIFRDGGLYATLPLPFGGILYISCFICLVCGLILTVKYC